jgi:uncharacterized protein (DUF169 family)
MTIPAETLSSIEKLELTHAPVAVAFLDAPPPGMAHVSHAEAAGCGYWKRAAEGQAFYTTAEDHINCPVGAFTHGVTLTPEKTSELESLVGTMIELKYLSSDEVPQIPRRSAPLAIAAYAPLAGSAFTPDAVIFRGTPRQIMLLTEAARAAGVFESGAVMGRPACAMLPQSINSGAAAASVGCIGNRVYTALADGELYVVVPGGALAEIGRQLAIVLTANAELEKFHQARARQHLTAESA